MSQSLVIVLSTVLALANAVDFSAYTNSQQLSTSFVIYWKIENDTIYLGLDVNATGWIAFGISEQGSGSVAGSDIVVAYVNASGSAIQWYATNQYGTPSVDACNQWQMLDSEETDGHTRVQLNRSLNTGDTQDRSITTGLTRVIWAFSDTSEDFSYHGLINRGMSEMYFYGDQPQYSNPSEVLTEFSVLMPSLTVSTGYYCYAAALPSVEAHIVKITPLINTSVVNYAAVWMCNSTGTGISYVEQYGSASQCRPASTQFTSGCQRMLWIWGTGTTELSFPVDTGYRIGSDYPPFIVLEIRYVANTTSDASGVQLTYTTSLRQYNAGSLLLGDPTLSAWPIPPQVGSYDNYFECIPYCSQYWNQNITLFMGFVYMGKTGSSSYTNVWRNTSVFLDQIDRIDYYNSLYHQYNPLSLTLQPGDRMVTHCVYDTSNRTTWTDMGAGDENEMCIELLYYYPDMALPNGVPMATCSYANLRNVVPGGGANSLCGTVDTSSLIYYNNPMFPDDFNVDNVFGLKSCYLETETYTYYYVTCPGTASSVCAQTKDYYCPAGKYCPFPTATDLQYNCTEGFYCPENTSQPSYCPSGYYCPTTSEIYICPEGYFCRTGRMTPIACAPMSICPEGSSHPTSYYGAVVYGACSVGYVVLLSCFTCCRSRLRPKYTFTETPTPKKKAPSLKSMKERGMNMAKSEAYLKAIRAKSFTIEYENLSYKLPNGKVILNSFSGVIYPGRVTAVMGGSGSGKTTFLNVVSGKVQQSSGVLRINGEVGSLGTIKYEQLTGFVPQDDIMHRWCTVRDTLKFYANTRLPGDWTMAERQFMTNKVIKTLMLDDIQYSVIGDEMKRGISGGQRKRVNIGMELVAAPFILFADEATTGLDSFSSRDIMNSLHKIAKSGIPVVVVLHQPSGDIFDTIDDLILISKGHIVYHGERQGVEKYFETFGFVHNDSRNQAEFCIDVISGKAKLDDKVVGVDFLAKKWKEHARKLNESTNHNSGFTGLTLEVEEIEEGDQNACKTAAQVIAQKWRSLKQFGKRKFERVNRAYRQPAPFPLVVWSFWKRATEQLYVAGRSGILSLLLANFIAGIFIGFTSRNNEFVGKSFAVVELFCPITSYCSAAIADSYRFTGQLIAWVTGFCGIMISVPSLGAEKAISWREAGRGISQTAYFIAKDIAEIPKMFLSAFIFVGGLQLMFQTSGSWFKLYMLVLAMYYCAWGIGYCISLVLSITTGPLFGVGASMLMGIMLSGADPNWGSIDRTYGAGKIVWQLSYTRYTLEAYYLNEISPYSYEDLPLLPWQGYSLDEFWWCVAVAFGIGVGWRMIAYLLIHFWDADKKK